MRKLLIGSTAAAALVAGSLIAAAAANADSGTVVRVVDGDTVVVSINNNDQTIRLLNVNTPETKDPNKPTECLGPEASEYLKQALPAGSKVRLEFDVERHDKYGRTLAGVFNASNQLVNAEIARRGLGVPMVVGENRKFLPPVQAAHDEACILWIPRKVPPRLCALRRGQPVPEAGICGFRLQPLGRRVLFWRSQH